MSTPRLLLLEDNPSDIEAIQALLMDCGMDYELLRVDTYADFAAALETQEVDLILAKYPMPGFDGIAALESACDLCPDVPFIFVSARLGEELAIEMLKRGATDYVLKQRLGRLVPAIQRALQETEERRDRQTALRDRTAAEAALRESEARFRHLADTAPVLIWMAGTDKLCDYFNQTWLDFTGRMMEQEMGNGWAEGVHPDDFQRCLNTYVTAFDARQPFKMEYRLRRFDGLYRWLTDRGVPRFTPEGEFLGYIGSCIDIDDRKAAEAELRESEERFRTLADNMSQLAWMADSNGWIFWYNHRWFEYTGTTLEEMQGWGWQQVHHPDHVDLVTTYFRQCLETGKTWEDTFPLRGKDGNYRWFLSRAIPIKDKADNIVQWFGTNTDISDRKRIEEELRQKNAILDVVNESAPTPIFVKDRQGRIIYANPATLEVLGKSAAEAGQSHLIEPRV
ncbi:MAG: hypothetical protein DCF22_02205 [Leptolyngbya sp.]|nr:MAG: hypothetical protein DCF22_02205 [Leptolyngbya sp.]